MIKLHELVECLSADEEMDKVILFPTQDGDITYEGGEDDKIDINHLLGIMLRSSV